VVEDDDHSAKDGGVSQTLQRLSYSV